MVIELLITINKIDVLQTPKRIQRWVLGETTKEEKNWGTLLNLQCFGGRRVCWSSGMGLGQTHK